MVASLATVTQTTNLLDEMTTEVEKKDITPHLKGMVPKFVVVLNRGTEAIVLSEAGRMSRFDMTRFGESDFLLEDIDTLSISRASSRPRWSCREV